MPPAFVLSQDQTLKFIPELPFRIAPNKGLQTFASCANPGDPPALRRSDRRPRIPSHLSTISNNTPLEAHHTGHLKGGALIRPSHTQRQHPIRTRHFDRRSAGLLRTTTLPAAGAAEPAGSRGLATLRVSAP
jgi:hypothetical protein